MMASCIFVGCLVSCRTVECVPIVPALPLYLFCYSVDRGARMPMMASGFSGGVWRVVERPSVFLLSKSLPLYLFRDSVDCGFGMASGVRRGAW